MRHRILPYPFRWFLSAMQQNPIDDLKRTADLIRAGILCPLSCLIHLRHQRAQFLVLHGIARWRPAPHAIPIYKWQKIIRHMDGN